LLQHICEKCGTGKPFTAKNGKVIIIPAGEYQITDKEIGRVLGTDRRQTVRENRWTLLEACRGAVTCELEYRSGFSWPVNVYRVDLEKLKEVSASHAAKSDAPSKQRKAMHGKPGVTTESDALRVVPSGRFTAAVAKAPLPLTPPLETETAGSSVGKESPSVKGIPTPTGHGSESESEAAARQDSTSTPTGSRETYDPWKDSCDLTTLLIDLFPTWSVDVNHIYSLVDKNGAERIYNLIEWLPNTHNPELNSSLKLLMWFKEISRQFDLYEENVTLSDTQQNYESWSAVKLAMRRDAAFYERFRDNPNDSPADPADIAEEAAANRADDLIGDGLANEAQPLFNPYEGVDREETKIDPDPFEGIESMNNGIKPILSYAQRRLIMLRKIAYWSDDYEEKEKAWHELIKFEKTVSQSELDAIGWILDAPPVSPTPPLTAS